MAEIRSIELSKEQQPHYKKLMELIEVIDKENRNGIDNSEPNELSYRLTKCVELMATTPEIMSLAKTIHSHLLGLIGQEILTEQKLLDAKQQVQKMYIAGRMARWEGMYSKAERTCAALVHRCEGLRSLLSYEKSLQNLGNNQM